MSSCDPGDLYLNLEKGVGVESLGCECVEADDIQLGLELEQDTI